MSEQEDLHFGKGRGLGFPSRRASAPDSAVLRSTTAGAGSIDMLRRAAGRWGCTRARCAPLVPRPRPGASAAPPRTLSMVARKRDEQSFILRTAAWRSHLQQQQQLQFGRQGVCRKGAIGSAPRGTAMILGGSAAASRSFGAGEGVGALHTPGTPCSYGSTTYFYCCCTDSSSVAVGAVATAHSMTCGPQH